MKKILIGVAAFLLLAVLVTVAILRAQSSVIKVVTAKVEREDISSLVSGTGQIKPKTYVNVGATAFGRITHLYVKEGDKVKAGELLASVESVQPQATVAAQAASIESSKTDVHSYSAAEKTAEANVSQADADLVQKKFDFERYTGLYRESLVSKADYDARKAAYDVSVATLAQRQAALAQARAQTASAQGKVSQAIANQRANYDSLDKTQSRAPFNGIVTNLPVREGETVVVGIQNAEGSTLMTLADMSVVTAEVKVDETDIVNVKLGQAAEVGVDALPGKVFHGHVTLVGDQALLRSTGIATSQSTSGAEEAKDFKVVVTLDEPNEELKPGLSATAKITAAHKPNVLTVPIQALTMRSDQDLSEEKQQSDEVATRSSAPQKQGVFLVRHEKSKLKSEFVPVTTGITGATEIEITDGLKEGQEIVLGPYKTLRSLKNNATLKRDNAKSGS